MHLNPAHRDHPPPGFQEQLLVHAQTPRHERAGDHGAESLHREDAVDRQTGDAIDASRAGEARRGDQRRAQLVEPCAGPRRHGDNRRRREKRSGEKLAHLELGDAESVPIDEIRLRERDNPRRDVEQAADVEVFPRLRHHRFVGRDDQQDQVDAAHACQHVLDEALVARHVDEGEVPIPELAVSKPQIDGDAAFSFFLEPIRIGTGQRLHERTLAVVDVACRSHHD